MRLGGAIFKNWDNPEQWALAAVDYGYTAVYFPTDYTADISFIDGYVKAAKEHDLVISEIGIWNNLLTQDITQKKANFTRAVKQLELADYIGARCCVNISGSYSEQWDGPHKDNLTEKGFEDIVLTTQYILDAVNPKHTCYSLEPMPWMYPDSADSYVRLIESIDRKGFAAHFDPVNIICSPQRYYLNGDIIKEWFDKLGGKILSCHAKDIILSPKLTVHLDECRPGLGELDYETYLKCLSGLDDNVCLMLEHMSEESDYIEAIRFIRQTAVRLGLKI